MTFKNQWSKIKDNWLLIVLALVLFSFFNLGGLLGGTDYGSYGGITEEYRSVGAPSADYAVSKASFGFVPSPIGGDFAPEVEERQITKSASISTEVKRGTFQDAETILKNIVSSSKSFLLSDNSQKYGTGKKSYYSGSYSIKVEASKYDAVVAQLKEIGEVQSFNENAQDVTGRITDLVGDIKAEVAKLARYKQIMDDSATVEEKLMLVDRILNQERRINYLKKQLEQVGSRVDYSTVSVSISEERNDYSNIVFVKFSQLIENFVGSLSTLLEFIFAIVPWAVAAWLVMIGVRRFKGRAQKKK